MNNLTTENLAELDKFFVVAKEYFNETGKTANMPSCVVDSCWHELMEDDAQYASFTNRSVGGRIEHMENKGFGVIEWVPIYERMFGKLANPWFVAPEGKPIVELKAEYGQEGDLRMAWDCTPLIDCPKERVQYEQTGELKAAWDCTPLIEGGKAHYERTGELKAAWDCTPNIEDGKARYERTGELKAAWDCTPLIEGGKTRAEYERTGELKMAWDCTPLIEGGATRPCQKTAQPALVH